MLVAGLVTLVQLYAIGPIGGKVPIIMGTSSGFLGVMKGVAASMGGGVIAYGAILGASIIGGLFETVLGFFIKPLRKLFPPVVTGTVVLAIGLSLISVGVNSFAGGSGAKDFGSLENLAVGAAVLIVIVALKHFTKGITSTSSILFGIIFGYIFCAVLGLLLPHTAVNAEGVEYTKAWVLNWSKIADAAWFSIPALLPVKPVFDMAAIIPVCIMFIVTAVETVGDTSGCIEGGMGREATDTELSGAVTCDGLGSSFAALFGVLPNTSFSQNVGLVAMTKVVNRFALAVGALFLVLCGLSPKLAAVVSIMPQSVLGGAAVMMFSSIAISGIQLITKHGITNRVITIVSVSLGVGYGLGVTSGAITGLGTGGKGRHRRRGGRRPSGGTQGRKNGGEAVSCKPQGRAMPVPDFPARWAAFFLKGTFPCRISFNFWPRNWTNSPSTSPTSSGSWTRATPSPSLPATARSSTAPWTTPPSAPWRSA